MFGWLILGAAIIVIASVLAAWFRRSEGRRATAVFELATALEEQGDHERACFHYAVALNRGADRSGCEIRIRQLWQHHGPFEFTRTADELRRSYCSYESCGGGYHELTVGDIRRIVEIREQASTPDGSAT